MSKLSEAKARVEQATVRMLRHGGQGVIVPGNLIITAAHCLQWTAEGHMALGDYFVEQVEVAGCKLAATPLMVEPVCDVAVLGELDDQEFLDEVQAYRKTVAGIAAVRLSSGGYEVGKSFTVHVLTHKKCWIRGTATLFRENANSLYIKVDERIEGGTSGGPVISSDGKLIGIVSTGGEPSDPTDDDLWFDGQIPRLSYALPVWVMNIVRAGR